MPLTAFALCLLATQVQEDLPPLGTNLAAFSEGSTQWPLVDAFKMSRPWAAKSGSEPLEVDIHGNVKSLKPGQVAETAIYTSGRYPLGKYTLLWKGKGEFASAEGSTLSEVTDGRAVLDVTGQGGIGLNLTKVDPSDPPREIKLVMPGYEELVDDQPFHPVFSQRMSLYRSLRFTDWQATTNSKQKAWSDRPVPADATYTRKGVPFEVMIDLCNEKATIPWFSLPHGADDDYVRNLAKLVKDTLQVGLKVAVEYSDQCWLPGTDQNKWVQDKGVSLKLSDNASEAGTRYYAQRSSEIFAIFEEVFGGKTRLIRVLSVPYGDNKQTETILGWNNANRKADVVAVSPSFGVPEGKTTLDDLFAGFKEVVGGAVRDRLFELAAMAEKNRLRLVAYGGGPVLTSTDPTTDKLLDEAGRDPRISDVYTSFLKSWRSAGGTLFMSYNDCGPWSSAGRWGTIEYQNQDPQTSFRNRALIQYALFPDR